MVIVDKESPAGAWERELEKIPWGYGQKQPETIEEVIESLRKKGMDREANLITREFAILKARR
jgi:hypothetical protein